MKYCDLHCHSNYSDGTYSPEELVEMACKLNLSAIALTDHNTLDGNEAFLQAAKGRIEACAGCEFTTEINGQELHLLGLFLNSADLSLINKALTEQLNRKTESNRLTIERLSKNGYNLSYDEFISFSGNGSKNRVHIARYLMEKGIINSVSEAFEGLLSSNNGYYVESKKMDFYETIALISKAGGLSVWAHPLFHIDKETCESILPNAKEFGLDGVEVYYSTYSEEDTEFMLKISKKYKLLQSGGSDFHGENKPDIKLGSGYGNLKIPYDYFLNMKERINKKTYIEL